MSRLRKSATTVAPMASTSLAGFASCVVYPRSGRCRTVCPCRPIAVSSRAEMPAAVSTALLERVKLCSQGGGKRDVCMRYRPAGLPREVDQNRVDSVDARPRHEPDVELRSHVGG